MSRLRRVFHWHRDHGARAVGPHLYVQCECGARRTIHLYPGSWERPVADWPYPLVGWQSPPVGGWLTEGYPHP